MAKRKLRLSIRIPPYRTPRNCWRREIHDLLSAEATRASISYVASDKLQLKVILYLPESALSSHDVDNRLKDIMDALQGRAGGSKKVRSLCPIIPNDQQIYRVTVEKNLAPPQSKGLGHLIISKYGNI